MLVVATTALNITSKANYWSRLRSFSSINFSKVYDKLKKLAGVYGSSRIGKSINGAMNSKIGKGANGVTVGAIVYEIIDNIILDDLATEAKGIASDRIKVISLNYMKDTFSKYVSALLNEDKILEGRLKDWGVKMYIVSGSTDKSFRVMLQNDGSKDVRVMSSFISTSWIDKAKSTKGDMKRLSDILEYEYFHSFHLTSAKDQSSISKVKSYRDNVLIHDDLDPTIIKATMAYSAVLYDLQKLADYQKNGKNIQINRLPTVNDLAEKEIKAIDKLEDADFIKKIITKMKIRAQIDPSTFDSAGISRLNRLKDNILDSMANTDFQEAAILFLISFLENYLNNSFLIMLPTKFKESEFNDDGVREEDNFKAFIIRESSDLDELGVVLRDGRSVINKNPGNNKAKISKFNQFKNGVKKDISNGVRVESKKAIKGLVNFLTAPPEK